jgi:signal transduction histidine kinase
VAFRFTAGTRTHVPSVVLRIRLAFGVVTAGFLLVNLIAMVSMRAAETSDRVVLDNMLTSIELVSRIARDVDQKRLAIDAHILTSLPDERQILEERIVALDADFVRAAQAYEPLVTLQGEAESWARLKAGLGRLDEPTARVLHLSRTDHDLEARALLDTLVDTFDSINSGADALVRINREGAYERAATVGRSEHLASLLLASVTLPGLVLGLLTAVWISRVVRRRDQQLRDVLAKLQQQNHELDAFAGRVAHDLRRPLATMDAAAQRLTMKATGDSKMFGYLRQAVGQMDDLIGDLLDLSRAGVEATVGSASVATLVAELAAEVEPAVNATGGHLNVHVEPDEVRCNTALLKQVVANLTENAVKYRRPDVPLELTLEGRRLGDDYVVRVSDNGKGLTPEEQESVFQPFVRGEEALDTPGTGLGLSIVKRVVEASGGSVGVESARGIGSTFTLTLKRAKAA